MNPHPSATPLSRRRLLAAGGVTLAAGSAAVLAACGTTGAEEETSPERNAELLNDVLGQQLAVTEAARAALDVGSPATGAIESLHAARRQSSEALASEIGELGGGATDEPAPQAAQAESAVEGLARQLEASLEATIAAIGELSPDRRPAVQRAITEDAAALAVLRSALGEPVAPDAFVLGAPAEAA